MPISLRRIKITDLIEMQQTNLSCLAENYHMWFWLYHYLIYPATSHCAVNSQGHILGYVLGKMDDDSRRKNPHLPLHAHITSVAVYNGYRKLGLATRLLSFAHREVKECYRAEYVNLHVRETNRAGHALYEKTLGYKKMSVDQKYYVDGEDAWSMRYTFPKDESEVAKEEQKPKRPQQKRKGKR